MEIRNLAARCLMVFRVPPADGLEAAHYRNAMDFRDHTMAAASMAKYQHQMEGVENTEAWQHSREEERRTWLVSTPPFLDHRTIAESDPDYQEMETNPSATLEEGVAKLEMLMGRYPEDWVLKVLHASQLLQGIDPPRGETIMRTLLEDPIDCFEGHSRYGTWLKYVGGRRDEAFAVYEDALRRWPWCQQASDACVWMLTDGMTEA